MCRHGRSCSIDLGFLQAPHSSKEASNLVIGTSIAVQAWAQMEYDLGFLQRADDLRKYSLEEQQEVCVCP